MRVTVDLDEDILRVVKDSAREKGQTMGRVLSDMVRRGLASGIPVFPRVPGRKPVTDEDVKALLELED